MRLKCTIAAIVVATAFAAPVAAGTFEDAVDANARGDYVKALRLIRPLANDGHAAAQFNLGLMYINGHGVQQDGAAAAQFQKAAEQDIASPSSISGSCPPKAESCRKQDYVRAHMWFSLSAAQGEQRAVKTLVSGRTEDDPSSDKRSAEARTRLQAGHAANSSLKECALRPVPQLQPDNAARSAPLWKRHGTVGHIGG